MQVEVQVPLIVDVSAGMKMECVKATRPKPDG
jgi:hypothetical protein